jgi:hypothetical protein
VHLISSLGEGDIRGQDTPLSTASSSMGMRAVSTCSDMYRRYSSDSLLMFSE